MTFTATFPIGWSPGNPKELFIEDESLVVEFDADVRIDRDPVEVDWPPVIDRGVSVECEASSVDIESAWLPVPCLGNHTRSNICGCNGSGVMGINILSILSTKDLARLKEECAEYAEEHALEQQANS